MGIAEELAALPPLDNIPAAIEQVRPIRTKYLDLAREQCARDQAGDPLIRARLQGVADACDRFVQLAVVRLWPPGSPVIGYSLALLTSEERNGF
jgi:hypothetical protein